MTNKIVGEARLPTDDPAEGLEAHVLLDQFKVLHTSVADFLFLRIENSVLDDRSRNDSP